MRRSFDDLPKVKCTTCREDFYTPSYEPESKHTCPACAFVAEVLASAKTSCGTVKVPFYRLWNIADAADRFEARGWTIALAEPSRMDALRKQVSITVKARDVAGCMGKPESTPRCYATTCGSIPSPEAVHAVRQETCRKSCPVAALGAPQAQIDALTTRCCTALSQITVDSVSVRIERADVPALIGAVRNLRASGWNPSVGMWDTDRKLFGGLGAITIHPKVAAAKIDSTVA